MLKTKKVEARKLTINSIVAVPTGEPFYVKSTRGLTKKEHYVIVEVKSIAEIDEQTLGMDVISDCGKVGVMQADKSDKVELVVEPSAQEEPATKKTIKG